METPTDQPHILLTSLGTRLFDAPTDYELDEKSASALLTPLALVQLLDPPQRPNRVVAMVTPGAESTTWPVFEKETCSILGFKPESVSISDGRNSAEIREIIEEVAQKIPEGAKLTLDVTQGFRHFPFIFYALVLYLTSLRGVKIRGAYYGMVEGFAPTDPTPRPIIDLQPLLELPEWFHAVRMFRDQGTTLPMATLLKPLLPPLETLVRDLGSKIGKLSREERPAKIEEKNQVNQKLNKAKDAVDSLERHSFAYESGLPLELGKASQQLKAAIGQLDPTKFDGLPPLVKELTDTIASVAAESAFATAPAKGTWKTNVALDENELKRQAGTIDLYLERDQLPLAVGLMREWVVSWAILKCGDFAEIGKWLDRGIRLRYERRLGALGYFTQDAALRATITSDQGEFGTFWNRLTNELRNALHHHGMRVDPIEEPLDSLEEVRKFWNQLKVGSIGLPPLGGGGGRLLLSPQGTKPGVLFSALGVADPDNCLVVCSAASASSIPEAAAHASFDGQIEQIALTDPQGGFAEINDAATRARQRLLDADEIVANMTGGTTLMGLVIQRLVEEAQRLDRPVRRFALIDRRPPAVQDSDPFVQGEYHWLDA